MERLLAWLDSFNNTDYNPVDWLLDNFEIDSLLASYKRMLINLYREKQNPNDNTNFPLRPSMLGKPALLIAYNYYHPSSSSLLPNRNARSAYMGYSFEQWVYAKLLGLGYNVDHDVPNSLIWYGHEIHCHADFVIENEHGKNLIIECKEVSDYYYKQWIKYNNADDDRGYLTQAALYSQAFDLPVLWIMGNKSNGEIGYRVQPKSEQGWYYSRAFDIVDVLINHTSCWEECFKFMEPEVPNITKKGLTVPFAMRPIADIVYELDSNGYVIGYKYPEGYEQYKPELP